jgi:hypothetical protein
MAAIRARECREPFLAGRERFYRRHIEPGRWLRVVVDFGEDPAWVVTAQSSLRIWLQARFGRRWRPDGSRSRALSPTVRLEDVERAIRVQSAARAGRG